MLLKRIWIILLCAVIGVGTIDYAVHFRFFDRPLTQAKQEEFQSKILLPSNFTLAASVNSFDTVKNTLQAAKQNVSKGSYALELNVAVGTNGKLYLADGPDYITEESELLDSVFKAFRDKDYLRYILNMKNFGNPDTLAELLLKYDLIGKVMMTGIALEDLEELAPSYCNCYICVELTPDTIRLNSSKACLEAMQHCVDYGVYAVSCTLPQITDELRDALVKVHELHLVIRDVHSEFSMYESLSFNPIVVITDQPDLLYKMMLSQDYLDLNQENVF
ncbi:MAG: hypothetical protein IJT44_12380 [Clostridia bacterium]|nr:hypothetical protein [Clostridia bacterium]